jgi:hypothetical protein
MTINMQPSSEQTQNLLSIFDLPALENQGQPPNEQPSLVWHCAWHEPYIPGATSGILSNVRGPILPTTPLIATNHSTIMKYYRVEL